MASLLARLADKGNEVGIRMVLNNSSELYSSSLRLHTESSLPVSPFDKNQQQVEIEQVD
eukprot:CAMPEP_0171603260 /NCGR_PEP_ID=MMETSP0990-20121206/5915_1 /TAXON_ID=483369 /ORGANISM="non described non described, Strain CCMP2098" /LENGTH=58 /DNA_ID=CAMNT_0012165579 /DNA_START=849 /DNA_END=1025 /DNA_ORIENTATION=-